MAKRTLKGALRALLPRTIKPHRILGGRLKGRRMVTSWHDYPAGILGKTEAALLEWLFRSACPGETWLDIGAHYGYTALAMSQLVQASGRVFAFEPMIATAGRLYETRGIGQLQNLYVIPIALGAPDEGLEIQHLPATRGMIDSGFDGAASEMLVVARFDSAWPGICGGNPKIHGVKIDVQGMELSVLRGMRETLAKFRPKLVIELHRGVDRGAILELLASVGYPDPATPIEPISGETAPEYLDDHSYAFSPATKPATAVAGTR
jgi:FkbM family methyltransferase